MFHFSNDLQDGLGYRIITEVKQNSLEALDAHAERFDGLKNVSFRVPKEVLSEALNQLDGPLRAAIETSITRVRAVSAATMPSSVRVELDEGAIEAVWTGKVKVIIVYSHVGIRLVHPDLFSGVLTCGKSRFQVR